MSFEYSRYVRTCLVVPAIAIIPSIYMLIACIYYIIRVLLKNKLTMEIFSKCILGMFTGGFFLWLDGRQLFFHGGIHLLYEKETDVMEIHGNITEMVELDKFYFPVLKSSDGNSNGIEFTVNNVQCKAIEKGSLEIGDYVIVKYLPKSGYILYIAETDRNAADIK